MRHPKISKKEHQEQCDRYMEYARSLVESIPEGAENKPWEIDDRNHLKRAIVFAPSKETAKAKYILELEDWEEPGIAASIEEAKVEEIDYSECDVYIFFSR